MTEIAPSPTKPGPARLELRTITDPDELFSLGDAWDELVRSSRRAGPFFLQGWIGPWWRHYGADRRPAVEAAWRDGRLVAALPLFVERRFGVRVARFLGAERCELGDLLLAPGEDSATARALADRVDADVLHLFGLPAASNVHSAFAPSPVRSVVRAEAPLMHLDAPWEELLEQRLSKRRRYFFRKSVRDLEALGGLERRFLTDPDELVAALEDAFGVYERRWEGLPNRSGFATPDGRAFHRDAIREFARGGAAVMTTIHSSGRLVAFNYALLVGRRATGVATAYEPSFARFSPGLVAMYDLIAGLSERGIEAFELLGSTEEHKMRLADELAPLHEAFVRPRGLRARALVEARMRALDVRARLKSSRRVRKLYYDGLAPLRRLRSRR